MSETNICGFCECPIRRVQNGPRLVWIHACDHGAFDHATVHVPTPANLKGEEDATD